MGEHKRDSLDDLFLEIRWISSVLGILASHKSSNVDLRLFILSLLLSLLLLLVMKSAHDVFRTF